MNRESKLIVPNTILVGAQKAATTSLYNWISQHPNVCGPVALKDYAFFAYDDFYNEGLVSLSKIYETEYKEQEITIHGFVNYMFFEKALKRIYEFDKTVKLIVSLRNPVERAISAFEYQVKLKKEATKIFSEVLKEESKRMTSNDYETLADLTYFNHGLYYKQLEILFKYFPKEQVKIVFYKDISEKPKSVISDIYNFLGIDETFIPEFKKMNKTGRTKSKFLQKLIYSKNPIKQKFVKYVIDPVFPLNKRIEIKSRINELNTTEQKRETSHYTEERKYLLSKFMDDINKLEKLLEVDLSHWKK